MRIVHLDCAAFPASETTASNMPMEGKPASTDGDASHRGKCRVRPTPTAAREDSNALEQGVSAPAPTVGPPRDVKIQRCPSHALRMPNVRPGGLVSPTLRKSPTASRRGAVVRWTGARLQP